MKALFITFCVLASVWAYCFIARLVQKSMQARLRHKYERSSAEISGELIGWLWPICLPLAGPVIYGVAAADHVRKRWLDSKKRKAELLRVELREVLNLEEKAV